MSLFIWGPTNLLDRRLIFFHFQLSSQVPLLLLGNQVSTPFCSESKTPSPLSVTQTEKWLTCHSVGWGRRDIREVFILIYKFDFSISSWKFQITSDRVEINFLLKSFIKLKMRFFFLSYITLSLLSFVLYLGSITRQTLAKKTSIVITLTQFLWLFPV